MFIRYLNNILHEREGYKDKGKPPMIALPTRKEQSYNSNKLDGRTDPEALANAKTIGEEGRANNGKQRRRFNLVLFVGKVL